jgi:hypothetical protein
VQAWRELKVNKAALPDGVKPLGATRPKPAKSLGGHEYLIEKWVDHTQRRHRTTLTRHGPVRKRTDLTVGIIAEHSAIWRTDRVCGTRNFCNGTRRANRIGEDAIKTYDASQ